MILGNYLTILKILEQICFQNTSQLPLQYIMHLCYCNVVKTNFDQI